MTRVRVVGRWQALDGTPAEGSVALSCSLWIQHPEYTTAPGVVKVLLNADGEIDTLLPPTDDPDTIPTGFTVKVRESIEGRARTAYDIEIPIDAEVVDLRTVAPAVPVGPVAYYATSIELEAETDARVAADSGLQSDIESVADALAQETTTRAAAIVGLQGEVDDEAAARATADSDLDDRVTVLEDAPGSVGVSADPLWNVKGDLVVGTGADTASRLAVSGTAGETLVPDSSASVGVAWSYGLSVREIASRPTGSIAETFSRFAGLANAAPLVTGRLLLVSIGLPLHQVVTSISFNSGSSGASAPTNQWFGLFNSSLQALRFTSDDGSTTWSANTVKTLNLSSSFTTTYAGKYFIGIMVAATTPPTMRCVTNSAGVSHLDIVGLSTSGLTTVPSLPFTAGSLAQVSNTPWGYVS